MYLANGTNQHNGENHRVPTIAASVEADAIGSELAERGFPLAGHGHMQEVPADDCDLSRRHDRQ